MKRWIIAFFLLPTLLHAEQILSINDFSGGLNTTNPSFRLMTGFSPYMRNVFIDNGFIEGINGYEVLGATASLRRVTGIFPYVKDTGQTTFLVTDSSVTFETQDFSDWVMVSSRSNTGSILNWMQVREKMWGFNGTDNVITWDGSVKATLNGSNGTPNVPKFKQGAYYQERVWGLNNPTGASDLDFSDVSSTDGVRLEPDDSRAWPATNNLRIGEGDGEIGTALWVQGGQLRVGKERSIYTIFGTNSSNYQPRKEENIGDGVASNETVVSLDGFVYWLGQYGIYENGRRIDDLVDEVKSINRASVQALSDVWETEDDFKNKGTFLYGTTVTPSGILTLNSQSTTTNVLQPFYNEGIGGFSLDSGTTFYFSHLRFGDAISTSALVYTSSVQYRISGTSGAGPQLRITIRNLETFDERIFPIGAETGLPIGLGNNVLNVYLTTQAPLFTGYQVNRASYTIKWELANPGGGNTIDFAGYGAEGWKFTFAPATTGQYLSEVTTISAITAWSNFDSVNTENGGSNQFFIRTATSVVNITTQTWIPITPGATIGEPTQNRFFQWGATISGNATLLPTIDNVIVSHIEGVGSLSRAFAINWNNRYWLGASTTSNEALTFTLVKAKLTNKVPDAFMPVEGIDVKCFAKNRDVFYAGASTWGAVYRMDYGSSFNGSPIPVYYDTPDMILGNNYNTKNISKYYLDAQRDSGLTWNVGSSISTGTFTTRTVSFNGTGRQLYVLKGVTNPVKTLRIRLSNAQLGLTRKFYDISVGYEPTQQPEPLSSQ